MPKQLKVHPGERIDLVDYVHGANEYTQESQKFLLERELLDRRSRILDGFRVRVEDQTANPGLITIFNGNAVDRDGQLINNEQTPNDSRSITLLGANLNFYVEIEFIENPSDTDARFFWDPTIPNTSPEPDGAEFSLNAATRLTPDWRIVTPVSTSSFEQTSNPNSIRIPVGVFRTDGSNRISTGGTNPGLVLVRPASVLEVDADAGDSTIRVVDSRIFPATTPFDITVDFGGSTPEARTVSGIDRENGILTLSVALANSHNAGAIVRVTSGNADLVREKTDPSDPALDSMLAIPGHPDPAQRLWQANEVRGSALIQSKETFGARDDLNIRSLKDQIDALAAQLRELKFGHPRPEVVSTAPPATFAARPRYFDRAGSVTGARSNTVSIGNGTTTFGDFNGTDGSALFTSAIAALPATGGTIYVKAGTYNFASPVSFSKPVVVVGDHYGSVILNSTNTSGPAISLTASTRFINCTVQRGGGADVDIIHFAGVATLSFDQCVFSGQILLDGVNGTLNAERTVFIGSGSSPVVTATAAGNLLINSKLTQCSVTASGPFLACSVNDVIIDHCTGVCPAVLTYTEGSTTNFQIKHCTFTVVSIILIPVTATGLVDGICIENSRITSSLAAGGAVIGIATTGDIHRIQVANNYFLHTGGTTTVGNPGTIMGIFSNGNTTGFKFENNVVEANAGSFIIGVWLDQDSFVGAKAYIADSYFSRTIEMVRLGGAVGALRAGDISIINCVHDNLGEHDNVYGVRLFSNPTFNKLEVKDCYFTNYDKNSIGSRVGIDLSSTTNTAFDVMIQNNKFFDFYSNSGGSDHVAAVLYDVAPAGAAHTIRVFDNTINRLSSENDECAGIKIEQGSASSHVLQISRNNISHIGDNGASSLNCFGIYVAGNGGAGLGTSANITHNAIYNIIANAGGVSLASGIHVVNSNRVTIADNYVASIRSAASGASGAGIRVDHTVAARNLLIDNNFIDQGFTVVASPFNPMTPLLAQLCIYVRTTNILEHYTIRGNMCRTSTTALAGISLADHNGSQGYVDGIISDNTVIMRTTSSGVSGIECFLGGNSRALKVHGNMVQETTYGAHNETHRGILVSANNGGGGVPHSVSVVNNTVYGPKTGALRSSASRIGIWMRGPMRRTIVSANMVDWNEPGVLEGIGIKYNDDITGTAVSSGHLCTSNFVRGDNSPIPGGAPGGEIHIDTTTYINGFLDSNQVGEGAGAVGNLVPASAAGGWTYGTNKLS